MKELLFPGNESTRKFCEPLLETIQQLKDELDRLKAYYRDVANSNPNTEDEVVVRVQIMAQLQEEIHATSKKISILECYYTNCMGNYVNN